VKSAHNTDCDRVLFSGLADGAQQADRQGYYYKQAEQMYEGRPVYKSTDGSNFLYWTHKGWVVGPQAGGRIAGLISPSVGARNAEQISAEWYTFITNAEWLDGEWNPAPALTMTCAPTPKITVWFNIHNRDCSATGVKNMDLFPTRLADLMQLSYHAQGNLARSFHTGGLLATHVTSVYSTIVSCAPIIKLSLGRHYIHRPEGDAGKHSAHLKSSCRFDGSEIKVDSELEKSNTHVGIKGTGEAGVLSAPLTGEPVEGTKYTVTLDGTGQVEQLDGKYLIKIGTMTKNCENRFVPEKGVWRCECLHYEPGDNTQTTKAAATLPPSLVPTHSPSLHPTKYPTQSPTKTPTATPTKEPTNPPTEAPSAAPTKVQEGWAYKEWWHMDSTANAN